MLLSLHLDTCTGSTGVPDAVSDWIDLLAAAERAGIDFVTLADAHTSGEPRIDALMLATHLAPCSRRIGLIPSVSTTLTEPFLTASQIATLDFVSGGRAGWEVAVSIEPEAGGYVGPRAVPPVPERFAEAAEYVDVVRALWDSWEDGAEIRDAASHRFLDRDRLHHIDHAGRYLRVMGPSITPRAPQGQPIVAVTAAGGDSDALAAAHADIVFLAGTATGAAASAGRLAEFDAAVAASGRRPGALRRLAEVSVEEAGSVAARLQGLSDAGYDGARLRWTGRPAFDRPLQAPTDGETLRERLGLPRPASRFVTT